MAKIICKYESIPFNWCWKKKSLRSFLKGTDYVSKTETEGRRICHWGNLRSHSKKREKWRARKSDKNPYKIFLCLLENNEDSMIYKIISMLLECLCIKSLHPIAIGIVPHCPQHYTHPWNITKIFSNIIYKTSIYMS